MTLESWKMFSAKEIPMYFRVFLVAAIIFTSCLIPAAADSADSDICSDGNEITQRGVDACTRVIRAGIVTGRALAGAYYERGMKHKYNRRYDAAIEDFSAAIKLDPSWAWPYVARGHAHAKKGQLTQAFADQETALRIEPTATTYIGRAIDLIEAGDYDRAIADINEALRLDPKHLHAFIYRGDIFLKKREFTKAIEDYNRALEIGSASDDKLSMDYARTRLKEARKQLGR
jgi:tetratricopeptide (TPR) repeat protein